MKSIIVLATLLMSTSAYAEKCFSNKEFMEYIDKEKLATVFNGEVAGNKINEYMMTKDRQMVIVEYEKSLDGNALNLEKYCIIGQVNTVTFNDKAIEYLYAILDKVKGQKT